MSIRSIAVDLTSVSHEWDCGQSHYYLQFFRALAAYRPKVQFTILTRADNQETLTRLEYRNIRYVRLADEAPTTQSVTAVTWLGRNARILLPSRVMAAVGRWVCITESAVRRFVFRRKLKCLDVDLLLSLLSSKGHLNLAVPSVCVLTDIRSVVCPGIFDRGEAAYYQQIVLDICRQASAVVVFSDFVRRATIDFTGIAPDYIQKISPRFASRASKDINDKSDVPGRFELSPGRYLLYPSSFNSHKNHELLLVAFGMARTMGLPGDLKLACVGEGAERRAWLQKSAILMGMGSCVSLHGDLSDKEFLALLKFSTGLVVPSLYESFPAFVIEAMEMGVPVACSCLSGLPETTGDAALLFDPRVPGDVANALLRMVNDQPLRSMLVQAGYQRFMALSDVDRMVEKYWELFESTVSSFPERRR